MVRVRPLAPSDRARWEALFRDYCRFYGWEAGQRVLDYTWTRIFDPTRPVHALVAEDADGCVIGIANYLLHDNTTALREVCYLQDLYVDPAARGGGAGRALIDWLVAEMHAQGWARLYWKTREDNDRARGLYDSYTPHSGFVRYVLPNPAIDKLRFDN